jgi:ABC-2 type transport system permease protein
VTILVKSFSQVLIVFFGTIPCVGFILFGSFNMPMNGSFPAFLLLTFFYIFGGVLYWYGFRKIGKLF